jgi:AcrR family transcriptional regulator
VSRPRAASDIEAHDPSKDTLTNVGILWQAHHVARTQAERSATTQEALLRAAIEILVERGWAATTAVAVCERAGCTRGALVHHYPNLSTLLAHALESLYDDFTRSPSAETPAMVSAIDAVWRAAGDRRFKAVLEAWLAAGNDPELAAELWPTVTRFAKLLSPESAGRDSTLRDTDRRVFFLLAREAMIGLALGRATNGGKPLSHERVVLRRLRAEASGFDGHERRRTTGS